MNRSHVLVALSLFLSGCGAEPAGSPPSSSAPTTGAAPVSYLLKADLPDTIPVMDALKGTEGQEVAVTGKVQKKVKGRALFYLTDASIQDCTECGMPGGCKKPWDYCCHIKEMKAGTIVVELRGSDGKPVPVADLGLRELDLVAVKGTLTKGEGGRMMLLAKDGWFVRKRPDLSSSLEWPQ
jgi:hypothetical protein